MITTVPKDIEHVMKRVCAANNLNYYTYDWRDVERNKTHFKEWDYWLLSVFAHARGEWAAEEPLTRQDIQELRPRIKRNDRNEKVFSPGTNDYTTVRVLLCAAGLIDAREGDEHHEQTKK